MINPCKKTPPPVSLFGVIDISEKSIIAQVKEKLGDEFKIHIEYNLPKPYSSECVHIETIIHNCGYLIIVNPVIRNIEVNIEIKEDGWEKIREFAKEIEK